MSITAVKRDDQTKSFAHKIHGCPGEFILLGACEVRTGLLCNQCRGLVVVEVVAVVEPSLLSLLLPMVARAIPRTAPMPIAFELPSAKVVAALPAASPVAGAA